MKITPPKQESREEVKQIAESIIETFLHFGIEMKLVEASDGLRSYSFALQPTQPIRMKVVLGFLEDLQYALSNSKVEIIAPIPDQKLIGVVVPKNIRPEVSPLTTILQDDKFVSSSPLTVPLGTSEEKENTFVNIAELPHLLIAGTTGSGKSTLLNSFIYSLISKNDPDVLRLILIDPKRVDLTPYNGIPHLLTPVITEPKKVVTVLKWVIKEMERRYDILQAEKMLNISEYHEKVSGPAYANAIKYKKKIDETLLPERLPYIVIFFDEFADVMMSYPKETDPLLTRLAQMSRAVGIHVVVATSRPSSSVVTTSLKVNIPSRIAFSTASYVDSRTILDQNGAEKLIGEGDMLYLACNSHTTQRLQGYFVSQDEIKRLVLQLRAKDLGVDTLDLTPPYTEKSFFGSLYDDEIEDDMYEEAKAAVIEAGKASTSFLQRKLRIGYSRAARLLDLLEEGGVIGAQDGAKPRDVRK